MREHRNFAHFYCISVTKFSTVSECILLEIIWIKRTFSSHSYGCFYVCMQCTSKNRQLLFYGRYLPFVRCRSRRPRHERKQSMCLSAWWKSDMRCTQQYVVSLDRKLNADSSGVNAVVVYKHLWSLERILVNFKPQNALKCLKYPPLKMKLNLLQIKFIQDVIDRVEFLWLDCWVLEHDSWVFSSPGSSLLNLVIVGLII